MLKTIQARFELIRQQILSGELGTVIAQYGDLLLVGAVAAMVGMLIVPLPTWLLDILLTINITTAVTILMVSIYISGATQIASYPTLLLVTTLYRLALDISATRLILLQANAGEVIKSFGQFVVRGNFVVGAVIFLIITLVQFIVITKGSERVAEVAARFTLDAMPGKQMSIDADMRAGIITFQDARARRTELARESQFYGAMDGAMKFVKGDAIASIVITLINIAGGLVIGIVMNGMSAMDAVQTYSILTIGNGLVSQIPALLISISAGMVVTRVASDKVDSNLGKDIASQLVAQPKAIGIAAGLLAVLAITPGLPKIPFMLLAALTGSVSYGLYRGKEKEERKAAEAPAKAASAEPAISQTIPVMLQLSADVTPAVDLTTVGGKSFYDLIGQTRNNLYFECGVIFPPIKITGNCPLPPGAYQIWLNEVPLITGQIRTDALLVNETPARISIYGIAGEDAINPATGKRGAWIPKDARVRAEGAGLQVWDTPEILVLHLTHFLRKNAREFIGPAETQFMVDRFKQFYGALVDEVVPKPVSLQQLTEILQRLAEEGVSVRDLKTVFQTLSEWARVEGDVAALTEQVRAGLKRKICYQLSDGKPVLYVYQLDPGIEEIFRNSIRQGAGGPYLSMDPESIQQVTDAAQATFGNLPATAQRPVVLTDGDIRRYVKKVLDFHFPEVSVLSYDQLTPQISVQPLGMVSAPAARLMGGRR